MIPVLNTRINTPLYEQLYHFYKKAIHEHNLKPGNKMLSVRQLSAELHISKNTVIKCYEQLSDEGYLVNKPRQGLFVCESEKLRPIIEESVDPLPSRKTKIPKIKYNLGRSVVDENRFPMKAWRRAQQLALDFLSFQYVQYDFNSNAAGLKEQLIAYLYKTRSVVAEKDQVVMAAGCNSLFTVLALLFKEKYSHIIFEEPGFEHARFLFAQFNYTIDTIPVDKNGIRTDLVLKRKNTLLYLTPSHQYPTGSILSRANRIKLLNWAQKQNAYIIEDDYDSIFRHRNKPIPALQGFDVNNRVIHIGTFSKLFIPSLRVAYMIIPRHFVKEIEQYSYLAYTVPYQTQKALAIFIEAGHLDRHLRRMKKVYKEKYYTTLQYLEQVFGNKINILESEAGLSILIELKTKKTEDELIELAKEKRIALRGEAVAWHHKKNIPPSPRIFIGFGNMPLKEIPSILLTLKKVWFDD